MDKDFVYITGASSGIGKEVAITLSKSYNVILCGRSRENLELTKQSCSSNSEVLIHVCDLYEIEKIEDLIISFLQEKQVRVNHFIHCAGFMKMEPLRLLKEDILKQTFNINVFSAMILSKVFVKKKINKTALKTIVYISSNISDRGAKAFSTYGASKGAIDSLMRCLAVELAPSVRVNSILPGAVHTNMTSGVFENEEVVSRMKDTYPLGLGTVADIASVVDFLISEKAKWITGQQITVDGGRTIDISG